MADATVTPTTSRTSIDSNYISPDAVFDVHLRVLSESYIAFFQERIRVEESYVDSLRKIHLKWKAVDPFHDDRAPSTVRKAWREVRDNLEREADTRAAFLTSMRNDVLFPLTMLKETQDRTVKRIKEDLKMSATAYVQFSENELPKLKRNYLRRCQDVEDYKNSPQVAPGVAVPQTLQPAEIVGTPPSRNLPQSITSPVPLRPPNRQSSLTQPATRSRSPSSATSLSDLAHHGKKQLNQLITFLGEGKGSAVREGFSGRGEGALRGVRAKREADDADKEYRKGVHWLETLRLNRVKVLEGGYKSLELFIHESTEKIKKTLTQYADGLIATSATTVQLSNHLLEFITQVSPDKDTLAVTSQTARSMALATPRPTLYYNFHVGECKDLIFGVSLVDYATSRGLPDGYIPRVVRLCVEELEKRGLDSEGIYRISGRHANVQEITHKIERDEAKFAFSAVTDDVYSISSILKLYLRELPDPLFKFPLQERLLYTEEREEHTANNFRMLRAKMRRLTPIHQATLKCVVEHLARIAANHEKNKMDAKNLAIVFGPVIFGEDEIPKNGDILAVQSWKDSVMEDLVNYASRLFEDGVSDSLPPLPLAGDEPLPRYDYGSSYTQVTSLPPKGPFHTVESTNDFTPQMPSRPESSIHPSRRVAKAVMPDNDDEESSVPSPASIPIQVETPGGVTFVPAGSQAPASFKAALFAQESTPQDAENTHVDAAPP